MPVPVRAGGNAQVPEATAPDRKNETEPVPVRLGGAVTVPVAARSAEAARTSEPVPVRPGAYRRCFHRNRFSMDDYTLEAVKVKAVRLMTPPITMDTLSRIRLAAEVPTEPSHSAVVPSLLKTRNQVAVPVALADESAVMALAVATPATDAPNAVAPKRISARSTWAPTAVSASAAWVPS